MKMIFNDDLYMIIDSNNNIICIGIAIDICLNKYCKKYNCNINQALNNICIDF